MRKLCVRLSVLALVLVATLAMAPMASANTITYQLTNNNLGISGSLGTVTVTDACSNTCVNVTISMNTGFGFFMNNQNGQGGKLFINQTGASLSQGSLINLSFGSITSYGTPPPPVIGSFTYTNSWTLAGGASQTTLTFTLTGISTSNFSSTGAFGFHFICLDASLCPSSSNTGFVTTGPGSSPPPVPEPGTLGLLGTGLVGIAGLVRRRMIS